MPWKGVTVSEERQRFLEDYRLKYYSVSDLAERFGISSKTAHKWIARFEELGQSGYQEQSRRPHSCPWQTEPAIAQALACPPKRGNSTAALETRRGRRPHRLGA